MFLKDIVNCTKHIKDIKSVLENNGVERRKIVEFLDVGIADPLLISYAKATGKIVVTEEAPSGHLNFGKKVKIPNVCDALGVKWINTPTLIKTQPYSLVLKV